jgi:hypothetical protein
MKYAEGAKVRVVTPENPEGESAVVIDTGHAEAGGEPMVTVRLRGGRTFLARAHEVRAG